MYTGEFDYRTLAIYLIVASIGMICVWRMLNTRSYTICIKAQSQVLWSLDFRKYGCLFSLLFAVFAAIRKVDVKLGGMDALGYKKGFLNSLEVPLSEQNLSSELLYELLERFIRHLTDEYRIYFFLVYLIIAASYITFIKTYCKDDKVSAIPFILLFFPFLKSFNTLKTGLAVAVFLLGLVAFKKTKFGGSIIICMTFFIHRMSILYIMFLPFYAIYKRNAKKWRGWRLILSVIPILLLAYGCAVMVRDYIISFGLLSGTELWYLKSSTRHTFFSRWPMLIAHVFLGAAMFIFSKKISNTENMSFVKLLCIFDIVAMPVSIALGFWRANEYLYVARLLMWGHMLGVYIDESSLKKRVFVRCLAFTAFVAWFIFRIYSEWDDMKVMPYIIG